MPRITASNHGEAQVRLLRVVKHGDRHDARDLTVSCRLEGDFSAAFLEGNPTGIVPGEALKNLIHATARGHASGEIEAFGLSLSERLLRDQPRLTRARVEITERPWNRLDFAGKPHGQVFVGGPPERRTTAITSNGRQVAVVSGLEDLTIMRTAGLSPPQRRPGDERDPTGVDDGLTPLLVATVAARWSYMSSDVTFGPYRQGVRGAIAEIFASQAGRAVQQTLYRIADLVLSSYEEISEITLSLRERPYRPADLFRTGVENPDDLFVALDEPVGVVEISVERDRA